MAENRPRVLIVEPNAVYRSVLSHVVGIAAADSESVARIEEARLVLEHGRYELIVLGLDHGETVDSNTIGELRALSHAPLILLTDSYAETLSAYEAGAEQILPKPFVPEALVGAVRTELRGPKSVVPMATLIEVDGTTFDARQRAATRGDLRIRFTNREWELLVLLLSRLNQFIDTDQMLMLAWGPESSPEQLRSYIGRIRQKLAPLRPSCELLSERGLGYCLNIVPRPSRATLEAPAGD